MHRENRGKYVWGFLFVIIGSLWLLSNLGYISVDFPEYLFTWQSILILIGLIIVLTSQTKFHGFVMIFIGLYFLLPDIYPAITHRRLWELFLPLILVLIGLSILFKRKGVRQHHAVNTEKHFTTEESTSNENTIRESTIMAENKRKIISGNFMGGEVKTVMGKTVLDLRECSVSSDKVVLVTDTFMGELVLYLPLNWNLEINVDRTMGSIDEKRPVSSSNLDPAKKLILKGTVFMGTIRIF